ncbi:hypothetical protein C8J56DRAFT_1047687 [Mycena floridula]|nr:hypothetical protein C8J56DRAFT_1047687 [Mycena floridula]
MGVWCLGIKRALIQSPIVTLDIHQYGIIVGECKDPDRLIVFADDTQARWVSTATMADYNTVAAVTIIQATGFLNGAPHRRKLIAHFHVEDFIDSWWSRGLFHTGLSNDTECYQYNGEPVPNIKPQK